MKIYRGLDKEKRLYFNRIEYEAKQIKKPSRDSSPVADRWKKYIDEATMIVIKKYYHQEKDENIIQMYDDKEEGKRITKMFHKHILEKEKAYAKKIKIAKIFLVIGIAGFTICFITGTLGWLFIISILILLIGVAIIAPEEEQDKYNKPTHYSHKRKMSAREYRWAKRTGIKLGVKRRRGFW